MNMHRTHKMLMQVSSLTLVLLLSGCTWFGKKEEAPSGGAGATKEVAAGDVVIATLDDKPILTLSEFEKRFNELVEAQPQIKAMMQWMPDLKLDVAKGLVNQTIIDKFIAESGVDKKPEYKKDIEQAREQAQKMVNVKHFREACKKEVSEDEIKKFYDEHKDEHQELMVSRGGIPAVGVQFEKEADAKAFLAKAQGKNADDFKKAAEAEKLGGKLRNFGMINKQSQGIDAALRDKIAAFTKPTVDMIKVNDKTFWVINAGAKEETKYRPLEEVKEMIKKHLSNAEMEKALEAKLEELKGKYKVKINEEILKPKPTEEPAKAASNEQDDQDDDEDQKPEAAKANTKTA